MDQADIERLTRQLDAEVARRFPGGIVEQVVVLQDGDDPQIEPGALMVRLVLKAADGPDGPEQAIRVFQRAHGAAFGEFREDLTAELPGLWRLEALTGSDTGHGHGLVLNGRPGLLTGRTTEGRDLTPVMTRLGNADLETLDALITASIAASRAEAVRWALARIRERPAYAQLRERAREIEQLKTEFRHPRSPRLSTRDPGRRAFPGRMPVNADGEVPSIRRSQHGKYLPGPDISLSP